MSRHQRIHVPSGIYYVCQRGNPRQGIFSCAEDYAQFEHALRATLRSSGAQIHAYCWLPHEIHLVLQIDAAPIGRVMQRLTSGYARRLHARNGESGALFRERFRASLLDADACLLELVHYIHNAPVRGGLSTAAVDHPYSSHHAYLRSLVVPWLTRQTVHRLLEHRDPTISYVELMSLDSAQTHAARFARVGSNAFRVIGGPVFVATLPRDCRTYQTATTLDKVIQTVTCRLGIDRQQIFAKSRQRELTLARALIAWYATERRIATLGEVSRRLGRDPSTLSSQITRYRSAHPELFKLSALPDVVPLAPIDARPLLDRWVATVNPSSQGHSPVSKSRRPAN